MDYYKEKLDSVETALQKCLNETRKELEQLPEGRLSGIFKKGRWYYSHVINSDEYTKKGINKHPQLIAKLARKEFLMAQQYAAENNFRCLKNAAMNYQSMDPRNLINKMSAAIQKCPEQYLIGTMWTAQYMWDDHAKAERMKQNRLWAQADYEQSAFKPEEKIHLTTSGVYVRSKSEALISEKLFDNSVPNRYEEVLWLEGRDFAPDFTFRDANREPFYWEHAGMMNDSNYIRRHQFKMDVYARHGIVPWRNLIVTYDTEDGAINMGLIDSIVKYQILPRL